MEGTRTGLRNRIPSFLRLSEQNAAFIVLLLLSLLPLLEIMTRLLFHTGIHGVSDYLQHLVLWITFIGSMLTSKAQRHLSFKAGFDLLPERHKPLARVGTSFISAAVAVTLARWAIFFAREGFDIAEKVGFFPIRWVALIMPVGFAVIALRSIIQAGPDWRKRTIAASGIIGALVIGYLCEPVIGFLIWPLAILLVVSGLFGTPIFIVLGGLTMLLFFNTGGTIAVIPNEAYTMLTGPFIPTIPLFTLAGFILSESKAGERLVRFFQACFGWLPGGLVIMTILISAFFTTFTGASGVTILALGGLLSYVLISSHYEKNFSLGLLTAGGSLGLLLPPSLPIILYGVVSQTNIKHMFIGGVLPDLLMISSVAVLGITYANRVKIKRTPFDLKEVFGAFRYAFWEILLPVIILVCYFNGLTTLVETSALAVFYTLLIEMVVHRDIKPRELPAVFQKCIPIIGGVLIILAIAKGLSYFIVDAEVPIALTEWVSRNIHSKYLFLILLNISLIITGCLMDIFSAIIVVVPLILPLGAAFDIHPVHLGVIFLVNLELGYLTPPVGINLFLASYRFNEPLSKIYRNIIPYLVILFITVLIITYIPWFSTGLLSLFSL